MVMTDILVWFLYQVYTIYILFAIYLGWDMQSISLNLKTYNVLYQVYTSLSCGCTWYLVYTWDMTTSGISCSRVQNVATLVYIWVIGYMRTSMEFKKIVWICSFLEFHTRLHIMCNLWIWLIFGSCLQSAGAHEFASNLLVNYCLPGPVNVTEIQGSARPGGDVAWKLCMWRESPMEHCCAADYTLVAFPYRV